MRVEVAELQKELRKCKEASKAGNGRPVSAAAPEGAQNLRRATQKLEMLTQTNCLSKESQAISKSDDLKLECSLTSSADIAAKMPALLPFPSGEPV